MCKKELDLKVLTPRFKGHWKATESMWKERKKAINARFLFRKKYQNINPKWSGDFYMHVKKEKTESADGHEQAINNNTTYTIHPNWKN